MLGRTESGRGHDGLPGRRRGLPRRFYVVTLGRAVSALGDGFGQLALLWVFVAQRGETGVYALALAVAGVIGVVMGPVAGALADRAARRSLLLATEAARTVLWSVTAWAVATSRLGGAALVAQSVATALLAAFYSPGIRLWLAADVPKESLVAANALSTLVLRVSSLVGPLIAGVVLEWGGVGLALSLNAVSFAVSATSIALGVSAAAPPDQPDRVRGRPRPTALLVEVRLGLARVVRDPSLSSLVIGSAGVNLCLAAFLFALPLFAVRTLHASPVALAVLNGALDAGVIVGSLWLTGRTRVSVDGTRVPKGLPSLGRIVIALGGFIAAMAAARGVPDAAVLMLLYGVAVAHSAATIEFLYQTAVPQSVRGRVMGVSSSLGSALQPVGTALGGTIATAPSSRLLLAALGGVCALLGTWWTRSEASRRNKTRGGPTPPLSSQSTV